MNPTTSKPATADKLNTQGRTENEHLTHSWREAEIVLNTLLRSIQLNTSKKFFKSIIEKFRHQKQLRSVKMKTQLRRLGPDSQIKVLPAPENGSEWIAGRGSQCNIFTRSRYASRKHFSLLFKKNCFYIRDHGSANGTFLNDTKLEAHREYPLSLRSTISVGVLSRFQNDADCIVFMFEPAEEKTVENEAKIADKKKETDERAEKNITGKKQGCDDEPEAIKSSCSDAPQSSINKPANCDKELKVRNENEKSKEMLNTDSQSCSDANDTSEKCQTSMDKRSDETAVFKVDIAEVNEIKSEVQSDEGGFVKNEVFKPEGLADDEVIHAFDAQTQADDPIYKSSQLSYSEVEEYIEISDSDEEITGSKDADYVSSNSNLLKHENDYEEDYDDDVIFLDSITADKENYPPIPEIKIEDDDEYTETDKKWIGKLFKTKEECDSFILSQREINESCEHEKEDNWVKIVSNCADEIDQILRWENEKAKWDEREVVNDIQPDLLKDAQSIDVPEKINIYHRNATESETGCSSKIPKLLTVSEDAPVVPDKPQAKYKKRHAKDSTSETSKVAPKKIKLNEPLKNRGAHGGEPKTTKKIIGPVTSAKDAPTIQKSIEQMISKPFKEFDMFQEKQPSKKRKKNKKNDVLTSSEKKRIKDERKRKLQELSSREPSKEEKKETVSRPLAPLKIKVTQKNRNEFLCEEINKEKGINTELKKSADPKPENSSTNVQSSPPKITEPASVVTSEEESVGINNEALRESHVVQQLSGNNEETNALHEGRALINQVTSNQNPLDSKNVNVTVINRQDDMTFLKSCLKKFSCAFLKSNKPMVAKLSVRFDTSQNIRYYETENRISRKTSSIESTSRPKLPEDGSRWFKNIVYDICSWNALWLDESKNAPLDELPPPFRTYTLRNVQKKFGSHEEYVETFIPLLLLELWQTLRDKWKSSTCFLWRFMATCRYYGDTERISHENLGLIRCESVSYISTAVSVSLRVGDIVIIQLTKEVPVSENNVNHEDGAKKLVYRIFGYVEKSTVERVESKDVHPSLIHVSSESGDLELIKLEILVKKRPELDLKSDSLFQINLIHHVYPQLMMCRAVCMLYKSPLCRAILSPNRPDMTLSYALKGENIFYQGNLDESQRDLILKLLASCANRPYGLLEIEGGPGTGKSHVILAFILQILFTRQWKDVKRPKVLFCSHANVVVDEMAMNLREYRQNLSHDWRYKLVRYGNLKSMRPEVRDISSYQLALQNEHQATVAKKMKDLDDKINATVKYLGSPNKFSKSTIEEIGARLHEYVKNRDMLKNSKPELPPKRGPSSTAEIAILENADVICTTICGCGSSKMLDLFENIRSKEPNQKIICIIDEAMQSKESETIIPLQLGVTHLILFGDRYQLRPFVRSELAQSLGINQSLFWRIESIFDKMKNNVTPVYTLKTQYRMNSGISLFPNKIFYQNSMRDVSLNRPPSEIKEFLFLVDNAEAVSEESDLQMRIILTNLVNELFQIVNQCANHLIGVITCHMDQARSLRAMFRARFDEKSLCKIEVNPIENVQGREFDFVVFLFDANMHCSFRANVAMTRGKYSLIIVTNRSSYKSNKLLSKLADEALCRNAFSYVDSGTESGLLKKIITKCSSYA